MLGEFAAQPGAGAAPAGQDAGDPAAQALRNVYRLHARDAAAAQFSPEARSPRPCSYAYS